MPRPLPTHPRGPRAARRAPAAFLLAVPRVAPDWELGALRALMKPQERAAILHRTALQPWPAEAAATVEAVRRLSAQRLGYDPRPYLPPEGDYLLAATIPPQDLPRATAFAVLLSRAMPGVWLVLGRLYLRDGRFFRRRRGRELDLVPANDVHLSRALRAAVRKTQHEGHGGDGEEKKGLLTKDTKGHEKVP